jgi:hypothetical protein
MRVARIMAPKKTFQDRDLDQQRIKTAGPADLARSGDPNDVRRHIHGRCCQDGKHVGAFSIRFAGASKADTDDDDPRVTCQGFRLATGPSWTGSPSADTTKGDRIVVVACCAGADGRDELAAGRRRNVGRGENEVGGANFAFVEPEPEYGPVPFCRHSACTIR